MASATKTPLGYVELENGSKAIFPMNDFFLTYTFEKPEHWESLRLTVNLLIDAYKQMKPESQVAPIKGKIKVETQFRHLLNIQNTTRDQDIKLTEDESDAHYIEFHNRARANPPVEIRSVEYFGLGIGHSRGKIANQIWLLAEDVEAVLHGKPFTRYMLKDEVTGNAHPTSSGIMYISLQKLSQEKSSAGELASFFLGETSDPKDEAVKKIAKTLNTSFNMFKTDKEVVKAMSVAERYRNEGILVGEARGEAIGVTKLLELIKKGIDPDEAARLITAQSGNQMAVIDPRDED